MSNVYTPESSYVTNIANIVCLFWFNNDLHTLGGAGYDPLTTPTYRFKSFICSVLQQSQLTPTALSLALYYIYRLKSKPISAHANSEYRVFTTALVLANKFLDDNTYTNVTWAKMTKLPLAEISVMEIEFLKCLQYRLVVRDAEWTGWQSQLLSWLRLAASINQPPPPPPPQLKRKRTLSPCPDEAATANANYCCCQYCIMTTTPPNKRIRRAPTFDLPPYPTPSTSPYVVPSVGFVYQTPPYS